MSNNLYNKPTMKARFRGFLPVVVDVETAGFSPKDSALLEVSMMTVYMDEKGFLHPKDLYTANIRPFEGSKIEQTNIDFLGIDPFDESRNLKSEREALIPMFKAISREVKAQACSRAILVGHNGHFDLSFIKAAADRLKYKRCPFHQFSVFDTATLSALAYGQSVLALGCMAAKIKFDVNEAHGSAYDTLKECELFCSVVNTFTRFAGFPIQLVNPPTPKELHSKTYRAMQKEKEEGNTQEDENTEVGATTVATDATATTATEKNEISSTTASATEQDTANGNASATATSSESTWS